MDFKEKQKYTAIIRNAIKKIKNPVLVKLCEKVFKDPRFFEAPASKSSSRHAHQSYDGGLLQHTAEVVSIVVKLCENKTVPLDADVAITAAIWHDVGKIFDYECVDTNTYNPTKHYGYVRHLSRSYGEFFSACKSLNRDENLDDATVLKISHAILGHHGRQEWGSPVEPDTKEAYAVHAADMLSAHKFNLHS